MSTKAFTAYVSGLKDPLNLKPEDVNAWDWAWGLQHQGRFSGATPVMWSVLSHTGLVYMLGMMDTKNQLNPVEQLALLLHDASEAYMVDMPRPIKHTPEWITFREVEDRITEAILLRFGITHEMVDWELVAKYDNQALAMEFEKFFPHVLQDRNFVPPYTYVFNHPAPQFTLAKATDYIDLLRHLAINLRETVKIADFDGLFRMPPHLGPYIADLKEPEPEDFTSSEDRSLLNDAILSKGID